MNDEKTNVPARVPRPVDADCCACKMQLERIAKNIHYPECWDTAAYPTLADAVCEITYCDPDQCTHNARVSGAERTEHERVGKEVE